MVPVTFLFAHLCFWVLVSCKGRTAQRLTQCTDTTCIACALDRESLL